MTDVRTTHGVTVSLELLIVTLDLQEDSSMPQPDVLCARILASRVVYERDGPYTQHNLRSLLSIAIYRHDNDSRKAW